ncbi:MAG TPA: carboxypeptidase-like regulatory domain-containing protein, partial [Rhodothermia bacterium]|nr:carboxypeptidase-like regulatory domain-containing protein [Rhodothermia bacterium]
MTNNIRSREALLTVLLAVLCSATLALGAASGRITGKVTDSSSGEELPGAHVLIVGSSMGTATALDGSFAIPAVPSGRHTLRVTYIGYLTREIPIDVPTTGTVHVDIELDWEGMTGEEVLITAQAQGQIGAINRQLNSITITNMVAADRIRELPDVNAAESIGRLPGVSIQRSGGEAGKVAIRGLSPKYNTVTVNGVRVPASGGDDRSVDLSLISSNMLDGIEVMKAITPDKDADAIGGAVDLKLKSAPEGIAGDLQIQGGYNQLQTTYENYKISGNVSNRFLGNKLGAIVSFHLDQYDRSADKFQGDYRQSSDPRTGEPLIIVSDVGVREETVTRNRTGASLVLDFALPNGQITANSFYNQLDTEAFNRINSMDANDNRHYYDIESKDGETSIFTGALAVGQDFNWFHYDAGVSRTASRTENPMDYEWRFAQEGDAFDQQPTQGTHPSAIPEFLNIDTTRTGLQNIYVWTTDREENESAVQLNLQFPFRLGSNVNGYLKTGGKLRWLDRFNDEEQDGRNGLYYGSGLGNLSETFECLAAVHPEWGLDALIGDLGVLPISFVDSDYSRDDFLEGEYPLGFAPDERVLKEITRSLISCGEDIWRAYSIGSLQRDYDGDERYKAAYAMAELRFGPRLTI